MNLICPHCQQLVSAADSSTGQLMKCPLCNESFSVPVLPQATAPGIHSDAPLNLPESSALAPPDVPPTLPSLPSGDVHDEPAYKVVPDPPKPPPPPPPPRREPRPVTPPPATSSVTMSPTQPHQRTMKLRIDPEYLPWVVPIALGLALFLMFFPWVGAYPGGHGVYTQTGFQTIWGGFSTDPVGEKVLGLQKEIEDHISANWLLMSLYFLLILAALALVVWPIIQARGGLRTPPALKAILPWRSTLLVVLLLVAFVLLLPLLWHGFGLEDALRSPIDARLEKTQDDKSTLEIKRGQQLGALGLRSTSWLYWEVLFLLVALGGASLELWREKRPDYPLPHADICW